MLNIVIKNEVWHFYVTVSTTKEEASKMISIINIRQYGGDKYNQYIRASHKVYSMEEPFDCQCGNSESPICTGYKIQHSVINSELYDNDLSEKNDVICFTAKIIVQ